MTTGAVTGGHANGAVVVVGGATAAPPIPPAHGYPAGHGMEEKEIGWAVLGVLARVRNEPAATEREPAAGAKQPSGVYDVTLVDE